MQTALKLPCGTARFVAENRRSNRAAYSLQATNVLCDPFSEATPCWVRQDEGKDPPKGGSNFSQALSFFISSASTHSARFSPTPRSMLATSRVRMRRP